MNNAEDRIGPACAFIGCVLLGIGTSMHPMHADPKNTVATFTEYAADQNWVTGHLLQFVGVTLLLGNDLLGTTAANEATRLRQQTNPRRWR